MKVTLTRFGRNRRLVLMFEWLTLWPVSGPLAVSSQRRDILQILFHPRLKAAHTLPPRGSKIMSISRNGGPIGPMGRMVKVFRAILPAFRGRNGAVHKRFQPLKPSYKGRIRRRHHGSRIPTARPRPKPPAHGHAFGGSALFAGYFCLN